MALGRRNSHLLGSGRGVPIGSSCGNRRTGWSLSIRRRDVFIEVELRLEGWKMWLVEVMHSRMVVVVVSLSCIVRWRRLHAPRHGYSGGRQDVAGSL